jgi:hypothetical protein
MPLLNLASIILRKNAIILANEKARLQNLMLRIEEGFATMSSEVVILDGLPESQLAFGLLAENYHVGEILAFFFDSFHIWGRFPENTTGWEYLLNGLNNDSGGREHKVSGIVLNGRMVSDRFQ